MNMMRLTRLTQENRGFTVIEVMVALTISLLLLLGVVNIFQASQRSSTLQNGIARLQENARFALHVMERSISIAGLDRVLPPSGTDYLNPLVQANTLENNNPNATPKYTFTTASGRASDAIEVTYASATDCLGNATPAGGVAIDRFFIATDTTTLMCLGNGSVTPQPLAEGIENMQILYGQDTTGAGGGPDGIADQYIPADQVTEWTEDDVGAAGGIASVRIALLVSTDNDVNNIVDSNLYNLLNAPTLGPFNDRLVRRVFIRTVFLRNYTRR